MDASTTAIAFAVILDPVLWVVILLALLVGMWWGVLGFILAPALAAIAFRFVMYELNRSGGYVLPASYDVSTVYYTSAILGLVVGITAAIFAGSRRA